MKPPQLILASRSPRRHKLLTNANYEFTQLVPPFNDPPNPGQGNPIQLTKQIAEQKALSALKDRSSLPTHSVILAADTIAIGHTPSNTQQIMGTPETLNQAEQMISSFTNATHQVITAVTLIQSENNNKKLFHDTATVKFGPINDQDINTYLNSGNWAGKAGGYNLEDRINAGWPIHVIGDPATVMGLPMKMLIPMLRQLSIIPKTTSEHQTK